jgi:hypothetical protein
MARDDVVTKVAEAIDSASTLTHGDRGEGALFYAPEARAAAPASEPGERVEPNGNPSEAQLMAKLASATRLLLTAKDLVGWLSADHAPVAQWLAEYAEHFRPSHVPARVEAGSPAPAASEPGWRERLTAAVCCEPDSGIDADDIADDAVDAILAHRFGEGAVVYVSDDCELTVQHDASDFVASFCSGKDHGTTAARECARWLAARGR